MHIGRGRGWKIYARADGMEDGIGAEGKDKNRPDDVTETAVTSERM